VDSHIFFGNELDLDPGGVTWPRALDVNDRALRRIEVAIGPKDKARPRERIARPAL